MLKSFSRRNFLSYVAMGIGGNSFATSIAKPKAITLGFSNYGMKTIPYAEAIPQLGKIGFDAIELCLLPGWSTEPKLLSKEDRATISKLISDSNLKLTSLMENISPSVMPEVAKGHEERLKKAFSLAHELSGKQAPLVQTVLGGGDWEKVRNLFLDTLGKWASIAEKEKVVIAIKPHRSGAMNHPGQAIWLINQLKNPAYLKMVYDPSHLAFRNLDILKLLDDSLPFVAHLAIKDAVQNAGKTVFDLAGAGNAIDYSGIFKILREKNYQGDVNCEVSSMVSEKPGYNPLSAAKTCYANMSKYFSA